MVDHITEIFLPGRTAVPPAGDATGQAANVVLPSFVAGPENRLVAAAISSLIHHGGAHADHDPTPCAPAVVALYGPSGCGKTHLARGVVEHWQEHRGPESAECLTATDFRRGLADAVDSDTVCEFRKQLRGRQLLAIDDLHQLPNDDYVLQELRYTLDELESLGATVIVTATQPVGALGNLPADLRGRLSAGLVLQLAPPGTAARARLVRQISAALRRPVSQEVAGCLASGFDGSARELFGAVLELLATSPLRENPSLQQAERLLASRALGRPTLREIITVVAKYFSQPQTVLKSASRRQSAVLPRAMIVFLARELNGASYEEIGRRLGGRDHTTIMHNYRKIDRQRQHDVTIQQALTDLRRVLLSS